MELLEIKVRIGAEVTIRIALEADGPRVIDVTVGEVEIERVACAAEEAAGP